MSKDEVAKVRIREPEGGGPLQRGSIRRVGGSVVPGLLPWAVGWWFVPIAAWFQPFRVIRQAWRAAWSPAGVEPLSPEEAGLYWRMHHGPLVRSLAPAARIKRYLQVHSLKTPLDDIVRAPRGEMAEPFMGHAELWYDRLELAGAIATPEGARAMELLVEDESKFVDFKRSALWVAKEHVFIDR